MKMIIMGWHKDSAVLVESKIVKNYIDLDDVKRRVDKEIYYFDKYEIILEEGNKKIMTLTKQLKEEEGNIWNT